MAGHSRTEKEKDWQEQVHKNASTFLANADTMPWLISYRRGCMVGGVIVVAFPQGECTLREGQKRVQVEHGRHGATGQDDHL